MPLEFNLTQATLAEVLAKFPRVAITGEPRCGKTTISKTVTDRPVLHTDPNDLKEVFGEEDDTDDWSKSPAYIGEMCGGRERYVVEGVTVARALRKGTIAVDAVIVCTEPLVEREPGQEAMGKAVCTILNEWREAHTSIPVFDGNTMIPKLVTRYTIATLDRASVQRTPQGGIRVRARLTKVGVFEYNRGGFVVREWRPPEEVLDPASWMTLKGATVVVDHPWEDGEVNPENFQAINIGHCEDPSIDGDSVWGWLYINHAQAIRDILSDKLKEVSCGYENIREEAPGTTPEGEPYDIVQRKITYNHVALGPRGWGRQGSDVALSLDANDNQIRAGLPANTSGVNMKNLGKPVGKTNDSSPDDKENKEKEKSADEVAASGFTDEEIAALKSLASMAGDIAKALQTPAGSAAPAPAPAPVAPAAAPVPAQDNTAPAPVAPAAAAPAPAAPQQPPTMDAAEVHRHIAETVELHKQAEAVLGEGFSTKGKTNRQIRLEVIKTVDSKWDGTKRSDAEVNVAYDFALARHIERDENRSEVGAIRRISRDSKENGSAPAIGARAYDAWRGPQAKA